MFRNNRLSITIFLIAFIVFMPTLFLTGIYWDDWVLYHGSPDIIASMYVQSGHAWHGILHNWLFSTGYPFLAHRIVNTLLHIFSAFLIYKVLSRLEKKHTLFILFIIIIYITLPIYSAKLALINSLALRNVFLFYLAFYFLTLFFSTRKIYYRMIALILFSLSFKLNSQYVYYLIIPFYILWEVHGEIKSIKDFFKKIILYIDFILLPIFLWIIRMMFFTPHGDYASYHKMNIEKILAAFGKTFEGIFLIFKQLIIKIFELPILIWLFVFIISIVVVYISKNIKLASLNKREFGFYFLLGLFLIYLGLYPYLSIGTGVGLNDWGSRTHVVALLGFSIVIASIFFILPQNKIKTFLISMIVLIFISLNLQSVYQFQRDWYKQLAIIENFKDNMTIKDHSAFLIIDNTKKLNVNDRRIRFYEYSGMFKEAFGDETRFALPIDSYRVKYYNKQRLNNFFIEKFKLSQYKYKEFEYNIVINGGVNINLITILKLKYDEIFNYQDFLYNIKPLVSIKVEKIDLIKKNG